jgi:hypothetical protein
MHLTLKQHWFVLAFVAAVILLAAVPVEVVERGPVLCMYRNILGRECLACGLTRALSCLLHGRIADAASYNRLVFVIFPLGLILAARDFSAAIHDFRSPTVSVIPRAEEVI